MINNYENKWKIKTNTIKFKIIALAVRKSHPITVDGNIIPFSSEGSLLDLHFSTVGITKHAIHNKTKARAAFNTIKRLNGLSTIITLHLIKACVLPVLTYPTYPLNSLSITSIHSLQKIQNKALTFAFTGKYPYTKNSEHLHQIAELQAINVQIYEKGRHAENRSLNIMQAATYEEIISDSSDIEHRWFKKPIIYLNKGKPRSKYTK